MPTITIRLDDDLKTRVEAAAGRSGKSPHALILDAIQRTIEQSEAADAWQRLAEERWTQLLKTGKTVPFDVAKTLLETRACGTKVAKCKLANESW